MKRVITCKVCGKDGEASWPKQVIPSGDLHSSCRRNNSLASMKALRDKNRPDNQIVYVVCPMCGKTGHTYAVRSFIPRTHKDCKRIYNNLWRNYNRKRCIAETGRVCRMCHATKTASGFKGGGHVCKECKALDNLPHTKINIVKRACLGCDRIFNSCGIGNRLCSICRTVSDKTYVPRSFKSVTAHPV